MLKTYYVEMDPRYGQNFPFFDQVYLKFFLNNWKSYFGVN